MENNSNQNKIDRRLFLNRTARIVTGAAALGGTTAASLANTAASYNRIVGSNDRISLAHIGIGSRGTVDKLSNISVNQIIAVKEGAGIVPGKFHRIEWKK